MLTEKQVPLELISQSQRYFRHHLKLVEEQIAPDAVVSGSLHEIDGEMEASVHVSSPQGQSHCRKRDPNPFIAIDKAIKGIGDYLNDADNSRPLKHHLLQLH